jgi:hypothetical protein
MYAKDALVALKMNMGPGGDQPVMRDGWFMKGGKRVSQKMNDRNGVPRGASLDLFDLFLSRAPLTLVKQASRPSSPNADSEKVFS